MKLFPSTHNGAMNHYGWSIAAANVQQGYTLWLGTNATAEGWVVTDTHRDDKTNIITLTARKGDEVQTITAPETARFSCSAWTVTV